MLHGSLPIFVFTLHLPEAQMISIVLEGGRRWRERANFDIDSSAVTGLLHHQLSWSLADVLDRADTVRMQCTYGHSSQVLLVQALVSVSCQPPFSRGRVHNASDQLSMRKSYAWSNAVQ